MKLIIKLKSDLCLSVGKGFASMIDIDTALDEYGIPYIPSRRLKGCLRELAGYYYTDEKKIEELFGKIGSDRSGSLRIYDAHIRNYDELVWELHSEQAKDISAEEVTNLFCSIRRETKIENGTASDKSLRAVRVVNMYSPIDREELEFVADIFFNEDDKEHIEKLVEALRNIGYHRNRGLGVVECTLEPDTEKQNGFDLKTFENADGIRITVCLESDLMLPDTDANSSSDYISGAMLLGAVASKYIRQHSDTGFNDIFYSDVIFGNLYPAVRRYDVQTKDYIYDYTVPAPRFFAKDKNTGEIFNCLGNGTKAKRKKVLKKGYMTSGFAYVTPETKIVYHNANIASEDQLLYMQHCLASGQYYSGEIRGPRDKIKIIAALFADMEVFFGRSKTSQYARCSICELKPTTRTENSLTPKNISAFVLESDVCLIKNGVETVDIAVLCAELGIDPGTNLDKLLPETSIATRVVSGYNAKWNLKKPQYPVFSAGSCLVFENNAINGGDVTEYRFIGARQNEGFGRVRFIADIGSLQPVKENVDSDASEEEKCRCVSDLIKEQRYMNMVVELALEKYESIELNSSQIGRLVLMAKEAGRSGGIEYDDFKKRIESIKKDSVREKATKAFGTIESLFNKKIPFEWKYIFKYIIVSLTLKKYQLRKEGKGNE